MDLEEKATPGRYHAWLVASVLSVALTLLAIVDVRRGFLFSNYDLRTPFLVLHWWHAALLLSAVLFGLLSYRRLVALQQRVSVSPRVTTTIAVAIAVLLVVDLFTYRLVPASRSLASGQVNVDWLNAFGVSAWWRPMALATSYFLAVWHATMLGILISALALTVFPATPALWRRGGFAGSSLGALFALPQPFCSCCSSVIAPSLVRGGASTQFVLAFVVGSPMLNVSTVALALAMLPWRFALTRIVAGVFVTLVVTYLVTRMSDHRIVPLSSSPVSSAGWLHRAGRRYLNLFDLQGGSDRAPVVTPPELLAAWLTRSARLALVVIPVIWVWSVLAAMLFDLLPLSLDNTPRSIVIAATVGAFFMVSTWAEIPIALQLIQSGIDGPAAALLVVRPAVSLPCMMVLAGAFQRLQVVVALTASVVMVGIFAGCCCRREWLAPSGQRRDRRVTKCPLNSVEGSPCAFV